MASSRSAASRRKKRLQFGVSGRLDRTLAFQELVADTGGLDNERTMSDADGGRTGDEAAIWSSQALKLHRSDAYRITTAGDRVVCIWSTDDRSAVPGPGAARQLSWRR